MHLATHSPDTRIHGHPLSWYTYTWPLPLLIHVYMATHSPDIPIHGHSLSWYTYIWSLTLLVHIYMVTHSPGLVKHFDFWAYLMKVIPEARRAHSIWYLRFYFFTYFYSISYCKYNIKCNNIFLNDGHTAFCRTYRVISRTITFYAIITKTNAIS